MDCPWFTDNCHGETIIKCCRTAKLNTEHFLSQNKNQKNCVVTSSCNWETEQWLKSCKRPKLNPTGISHSLWKWRFYHEIIKARTANSWCARTYNLACHPGSWECLELVRKQPVTNQPLTHCSPQAEQQNPPPAGHSLSTNTRHWTGRICVHVPITPGQASSATAQTKLQRCWGPSVGEKGAQLVLITTQKQGEKSDPKLWNARCRKIRVVTELTNHSQCLPGESC